MQIDNQIKIIKELGYSVDYNFLKVKPHYLIVMSVPPLMIAKISEQIYEQWGGFKTLMQQGQ